MGKYIDMNSKRYIGGVMRIKIEDLPEDAKISKEEARKIKGGNLLGWLLGDGDGNGGKVVLKPTMGSEWPTFK